MNFESFFLLLNNKTKKIFLLWDEEALGVDEWNPKVK